MADRLLKVPGSAEALERYYDVIDGLVDTDTIALRDLAWNLLHDAQELRRRRVDEDNQHAAGYRQAITDLRDDDAYRAWDHANAIGPAGARSYVDAILRDVAADFLESRLTEGSTDDA